MMEDGAQLSRTGSSGLPVPWKVTHVSGKLSIPRLDPQGLSTPAETSHER